MTGMAIWYEVFTVAPASPACKLQGNGSLISSVGIVCDIRALTISAASADFCSTLSVCLEFWLLGVGISFESRVPSGLILSFDTADVADFDLELSKRDVRADVAMLRPSRTPLARLMMEKPVSQAVLFYSKCI